MGISNIESAVAAFEEKFPKHEFNWKISPSGTRAVGRCPFHSPDNHPSFNIFLGDNNKFYYNCFSCHESGSVDVLTGSELSEEDRKRIEESKQKQVILKTLRDKTKENLVYAIQNDSLAGQYFCNRTNLSDKLAVDFLEHYSDIGLIDRNIKLPDFIDQKQRERLNNGSYLAFFYRTINGWITMIHVRKINTHDFETIKFSKLPSFFIRNSNMFSDTKVIFLVEGEFDAMAMDAALFAENQAVVGDFAFAAVAGTSGYTLDVINEAKKTGAAVVLLPDSDKGGENALINLYKILKQKKADTSNIQIAKIPDMFDAEDGRVKDVDEWFYGRKTTEIKLYLGLLKIQTLKEYAANIELKEYFETLKNIDLYPTNIKQILIKQQENKFNGSFVENIENVNESWDKYINRNSDIVNVGGVQLQQGAVNLIAADNGIGKTFITLQLCVNYILKKLKRVFFWAGEDDKATIIKRLNLIFSRMDSEEDIQIVKERLDIATYISEPFFKTDYGNVEETKEFKIFQMMMKDDQYGMIILDPLSTFLMMIPETDNTKVRWGMTKFNKIVAESDKILVFTHHINKDSIRGDGSLKELNKKLQNGENMDTHEVIDIANGLKAAIRGGMAITDLPRLVYFVLATQPSADGYAQRLLFRIKSNAGLTQEYIPIKLPFKSQIQQQTYQNQSYNNDAVKQGNNKEDNDNHTITESGNPYDFI